MSPSRRTWPMTLNIPLTHLTHLSSVINLTFQTRSSEKAVHLSAIKADQQDAQKTICYLAVASATPLVTTKVKNDPALRTQPLNKGAYAQGMGARM